MSLITQLNYDSAILKSGVTVFSFDGATGMGKSPFNDLPVTGFTFSCWIKTAQSGAVIMTYTPPASNPVLTVQDAGNITIGFGSNTVQTLVSVADNAWHYLAITVAPSDSTHFLISICKDGLLVFSGTGALQRTAGQNLVAGGSMVLGLGASGQTSFVGQMSEFRWFSRMLTTTEILTGMQASSNVATVINWGMDTPEDSGTISGTTLFVPSSLTYLTQELVVTWAGESATSYNVQLTDITNGTVQLFQGNTGNSLKITIFQINHQYTAMVQPQGGTWSNAAEVTVLNLQQVLPTISTTLAGTVLNCLATWGAADQALAYLVSLYKNGSTTPEPSPVSINATTYDLSANVISEDAWRFAFQSNTENSLGPANNAAAPAAMTQNFFFVNDQNGGYLEMDWNSQTGIVVYYLQIYKTVGGTSTLVYQALPGAQQENIKITSAKLPCAEGDILSGRIRAITAGTIGAWTPEGQVVVHYFSGPVNLVMTADLAQQTITLTWQFTGNAGFRAKLWKSGSSDAPVYQDVAVGMTTCVFTNVSMALYDVFYAQVQAVKDNSYGLWSQQQNTTVGLSCSLNIPNVSPSGNGSGILTVIWTNPDCNNGTTFEVVICRAPDNACPAYSSGNPACSIVGQNIARSCSTQTSDDVTWSDTIFKDDPASTVYCVQVRATQEGFSGPWQQGDRTFTQNEVQPVPPGPPGPNNPSGGDPVNLSAGNYAYSGADLCVPALLPLEFETFYDTYTPIASENSAYTGKPMGNRWNHSYNTVITVDNAHQKLYVNWGTGNVTTYIIPSSVTGTYAISGVPNGDTLYFGPYDNGNTNQYVLTRINQTKYIFNAAGRLEEIISLNGSKTTLQYASNQLQTITDSQFGSFISLKYDANGRIIQLTDNTGRTVKYTYASNGDLTSRTNTCGKVRTFGYSDSSLSLIATISDQNGDTVNTFIKNTYNADKKVIFQQDARAVAANANYGFTFSYSEVTENGVEMVVANVVDRMSNTSTLKSIKANCNLVQATYDLGDGNVQQVSNTFDGLNNLLTQTIYEGPASEANSHTANVASYTYDGDRNLLSLSYPAPVGQVAAFTYNENNLPLSFTDSIGNTTSYEYDVSGRLIKTTGPTMATKEITYYDTPAILKGLVKTVKSETGNVKTYTYVNNSPYEVVVTNADQSSNRSVYNALFQLTTSEWKDSAGNVLKTVNMSYDNEGRMLTQSTQYAGQPAASAYQKTYTYNDLGLMATYTDPMQSEWEYFYDPNELIQQVIYPSAPDQILTTLFEYNKNDNPVKTIYAPGVQEQYTFDPIGRMLTHTDGNNQVFNFGYGMQLDATGPYPSVSTVQYPTYDQQYPELYNTVLTNDCLGRATSLKNPAGQLTNVAYSVLADVDSGTFHQQVTYTLPPAIQGGTANTVTEVYDALGRLISYQDQEGKITHFSYAIQQDSVNPAIHYIEQTVTDPLGNRYVSRYSENKDLIGFNVFNPDGTMASGSAFSYDALGRILQTEEQMGVGTVMTQYGYSYNAATGLMEVTVGVPGGDATKNTVLAFSGTGQQVSQTDALGNVTTNTYTPGGLLESVTNANNEVVSFGYDAAQRYNSLTQPGNNVTFQVLDGNGNNVETQVNGITVISRVFDQLNRMTARTYVAENQTVGYRYNPMNKVTQLAYPGTKNVDYLYDGLQQMTQVTDWNNRITTYQYDADGKLQHAQLPNLTDAQYTYDAAGRLMGLTNKNGTAIISSVAYSKIDAMGNRGQMNGILPIAPGKALMDNAMGYNDANELATFNALPLTYDTAGNTLNLPGSTDILQYNAQGQLTAFGSNTYTYDADGLRTQTNINGIETNYIQDINQYASPFISQASPDTNIMGISIAPGTYGITEFTPFSKQLLKSPVVLSKTLYSDNTQQSSEVSRMLSTLHAGYDVLATIYYLNSGNVSEDAQNKILGISATGETAKNYVYGQGLISSEDSEGVFRVYHFDALGNTLALTDEQGKVTDKYAYDPFGNLTAQSGSNSNPFLFSGREGVIADANNLLYMRARYYDQTIQRFISRDYIFGSTQLPQTLNPYVYVIGNPILYTDPLGLSKKDGGGGSTGGIIAGVVIGAVVIGVIGGAVMYFGGGLAAGAGAGAAAGGGAAVIGAASAEAEIELQSLLGAEESGSELGDVVQTSRNGLRNRFPSRLRPF